MPTSCWGWSHNWGKWETITRLFNFIRTSDPPDKVIQCSELWQKRTCSTCGYRQDEKIRDGT